MTDWKQIRRLARERWRELRSMTEGDGALALLKAAEEVTEIVCRATPAHDPLLCGGVAHLDPEAKTIWYDGTVPEALSLFYRAHEYAHWWLDRDAAICVAVDMDGQSSEEALPIGVQRVEGYGPAEWRERQANVFALELLLPAPLLRRWFLDQGLRVDDMERETGLLDTIILRQLSRAVLTPDAGTQTDSIEDIQDSESHVLDSWQQAAALVMPGPVLLEAGPGTGKTKTLVARILHLVQDGEVPPSAILALTFSNKAAQEMRERVDIAVPSAAPHIWMGTFHAFALEILRKYGTLIGLPADPVVLDPSDALTLLERLLPELGLDHYRDLHDPVLPLHDLFEAFSRAKDELAGPNQYIDLAEQMATQAESDDEIRAAERALEVARSFGVYQAALEREGLLDFGDLIMKAVAILQTFPEVRNEVRRQYLQILIDEYQDVNRASGVLLREIADQGYGLWVVADIRQSIYRFRGAAPRNVQRFGEDFPSAKVLTLQGNYRSCQNVIESFSTLAPAMRATVGMPFEPWKTKRDGEAGEVLFEIADTLESEVRGIANEIKRRRLMGVPYREQAVLCRSHTGLARIAALLEREEVPVLYLGNVFERPEVRDLLALLALVSDRSGYGLLRVARFEEYAIPLADVLLLLATAKKQDIPFPAALRLTEDDGIELSARGIEGLRRLQEHVQDIYQGTTAWRFLVNYLFSRSNYLAPLLEDNTLSAVQKRLAIHQLLELTHNHQQRRTDKGDPKAGLLLYIRRLEIMKTERQLRQVSEAAAALDAVRLLTVHSSKGLEFRAVYVPYLGTGKFPASRKWQPCPPPSGLHSESEIDRYDEEEECLFFVALSRAKDVLCLSRAKRYGGQNSTPSRFLYLIAPILPRPPEAQPTWTLNDKEVKEQFGNVPASVVEDLYDARELDVYMTCPRKYFYEYILGLSGGGDSAPYLKFHRCVYRVLDWHAAQRRNGLEPDVSEILGHLPVVC